MSTKSNTQHYVLCEAHGQIRVIDESGEDYLYPQEFFLPIEIPEEATRAFAHGS